MALFNGLVLLALLMSTVNCALIGSHKLPDIRFGFELPFHRADWVATGRVERTYKTKTLTYASFNPKTGKPRSFVGKCGKPRFRGTISEDDECCSPSWSRAVYCRTYYLPINSDQTARDVAKHSIASAQEYRRSFPPWDPHPHSDPHEGIHMLGWRLPTEPELRIQWLDAGYTLRSFHKPGYASINPATHKRRNPIGRCSIGRWPVSENDECCVYSTAYNDIQLCRAYRHRGPWYGPSNTWLEDLFDVPGAADGDSFLDINREFPPSDTWCYPKGWIVPTICKRNVEGPPLLPPHDNRLLGWQLPADSTGWVDSGYHRRSWHKIGYASISPRNGMQRQPLGQCQWHEPILHDQDECCFYMRAFQFIHNCRLYKYVGPLPVQFDPPALPAVHQRRDNAIGGFNETYLANGNSSTNYSSIDVPSFLPRERHLVEKWQIPANKTGWVATGHLLLAQPAINNTDEEHVDGGGLQKRHWNCNVRPSMTEEEYECCTPPKPGIIRHYCEAHEWINPWPPNDSDLPFDHDVIAEEPGKDD